MSIPLWLLGLVAITIALVSWNRSRIAPATRRNASSRGDFSPAFFVDGGTDSAACGDGAASDGGGCDGGGGGD
jgi:hypothetical protein